MAHQFHAELMGLVLGMRGRRQGEAAPSVWRELLLLQLGVQATGECHLEMQTVHGYSLYKGYEGSQLKLNTPIQK